MAIIEWSLNDGTVPNDFVVGFQADGVACLRDVISQEDVVDLRAAIDDATANPGQHATSFTGEMDAQSFFADLFIWTRIPAYKRHVVSKRMAKIATRLMGSRKGQFFFDHLLIKEEASDAPTPWHQDAPYFPIDGNQCCTIWIALDQVTLDNGAMEFVRGSHRDNVLYAPESFYGDGSHYNEKLKPLPAIEEERDRFDIVTCALKPGDCTIHHHRTFHGAPANNSAIRRRGIAARWIGDDITFCRRDGVPAPLAGYLDDFGVDLKTGDTLSGHLFPVIVD